MAKQTWLDEVEASKLIGLPINTLTRYCNEGKIKVRIARATRKAKPRFVKEDIETHLAQSIRA